VHGHEAAASRRRQAQEEIAMNIKRDTTKLARIPLAAAVVLVLGLVACDRRDVEDDKTATPAEPTATREAGTPPTDADRDVEAPTATNAPEPPDTTAEMPAGSPTGATATTQADALAMLMAVNEHEIAAADQALGKNVTGAVRDFAQMMKTDHGKNLADTTKLGGAASTSPGVKMLKDKGDADLRTLDAHSGKAYEKAYIDAMVKGHTDALAMIDNTLLPAATDTNIRQHFTTTRAAVARHLDKAKEIQGTLK
jgi:putative membrane protein